jgi:hypothetical protein
LQFSLNTRSTDGGIERINSRTCLGAAAHILKQVGRLRFFVWQIPERSSYRVIDSHHGVRVVVPERRLFFFFFF